MSTPTRDTDGAYIKLYNADKKEPIGIFKTTTMASMYLYLVKQKSRYLIRALKSKSTLRNTRFDFPVAVRLSKENTDVDQQVYGEYPSPKKLK